MENESPNVFTGDAFSAVTLSQRVSRLPFVPQRIGQLGIFETSGIRTTSFEVALTDGVLTLIDYSERDASDNIFNQSKRRAITFETGHFPLRRTIHPTEFQNVLNMDQDDLETNLLEIVDEKAAEMTPSHDVTLEFQRMGALRGYVLEANGVDIREDLYDRFKITPKTLSFGLNDPSTEVRIKALTAKRMIEAGLGGSTYVVVRALCGHAFFDAMISHAKVKSDYQRWSENGQMGEMLRIDPRFSGFEYGGIIWEEYRGRVGGVDFIAPEECQIFPIGVPGMYRTHFAPANMVDFVNTKGLPRYASIEKLKHGRGYELLTESNPFSINTRPDGTVKGTM